jgi:hypothetical protein
VIERELKPLKDVNLKIIQEPLNGILRNVDMDLLRRIRTQTSNQSDENRQLTLLLVMLRHAINAYQAVAFLLSDIDQHPRRLPRFAVTLPPINRQIVDLWFSLVYMMDDFVPRSLAFELCSWREHVEQIQIARAKRAHDPEWEGWFEDMNQLKELMEASLPITDAMKANPSSIPYWYSPTSLVKQVSECQSFLQFLNELLYHKISNEAHLKPAGLLVGAGILLADIAPQEISERITGRTVDQYTYMNLFQLLVPLVGIVSEIELYCRLGNQEQLAKVWKLMADNNPDAKDVFEARYKGLLK